MTLSAPQIAVLARGAFPADQVVTAVAVALAEHRGNVNPAALGDLSLQTAKWGPSVGVWQIRSLKPATLAKATGADRYRDQSRLTDPTYNATAAAAVWREAGWGAWSTYGSIHLMYLPQARAAASSAPAGGSSPSPAGAGSTTQLGSIQPVGFGPDDLAGLGLGGLVAGINPGLGLPLNLLTSPGDMLDAARQGVGLLANLVAFITKAAAWLGNQANWLRIAKVWLGSWLVILGLGIAGLPYAGKVAQVVPMGKAATAVAGAAKAGQSARAATAAAAA